MATVTIASQVTELPWDGATPPRLRIYAKIPFIAAGNPGVPVHAGNQYGGRAYRDVACTLDGSNRVVTPSVTLPSTTDSDAPDTAEYMAFLYSRGADQNGQYQEFSVFSAGFKLDHESTSTTWEDIRLFDASPSGPAQPADRIINNLTVNGTTTLKGPVTSDDTFQIADDVNVTGTVTAAGYVGNGSLLTGVLGVGPGGSSSTGSHTFLADSDNNDPAAVAETHVGTTAVTRAHRDYFESFKPLRLPAYADEASLPASGWARINQQPYHSQYAIETSNVLNFVQQMGADPTGAVNALSLLNDAIDRVSTRTRYGGTLYINNGTYLMQGSLDPNTFSFGTYPQLLQGAAPMRTVKILGESWGRYAITGQSPAEPQGVVLDFSSITSVSGSPTHPAAIAPAPYVDTQPGPFDPADFSAIVPEFENLIIQLAPDSPLTGLQLHNAVSARIKNVTVTTTDTGSGATEPTTVTQVGVYLPAVANNSTIIVDGVIVYGCYYGYGFSERAHFIDAQANFCKAALLGEGQHLTFPTHASYGTVSVVYCPVILDLNASGQLTQFRFNVLVEHHAAGPWYARGTYDILDTGNKGRGEIIADESYDGATPSAYVKKQGGAFINAKTLYALANPVASATLAAAPQAIPTGTPTALSWALASQNLEGMFAGGTPTRCTFTTPGPRLITITVEWAANATGNRALQVRQDGTTYLIPAEVGPAASGVGNIQSISFTVTPTVAGTWIEVMVSQSSGGSLGVAQARIDIVRL